MRIAICTECYVPEVNGVVYHIEALCEGLKEAGHEVLIVKPNFRVWKTNIKDNILDSPAIRLRRLYDYSFSFPKSPKRLKLLKEWKPDIIHMHTEFSQGVFAMYAGKKLSIPIVYTLHTMYYDYAHYLGVFKNMDITKKIIDSILLKFINSSEAVICASKKLNKFLLDINSSKPIHFIPNTCIVKNFDFNQLDKNLFEELKKKNNIKDSDFTLCFSGRIAAEKNIKKMIECWKPVLEKIPSAKLIIIGDGPDKNMLEETVVKMQLEKNIIFTGKIHHDLIKYYYHMCQAYLMASLSENHSISALEATACGLPIVHLYDEQNEYQYIEGVTGFAFNNEDELIQILTKIYDLNKTEFSKKKFKDEIIKKAIENDYREAARKTLEIYALAQKNYAANQN